LWGTGYNNRGWRDKFKYCWKCDEKLKLLETKSTRYEMKEFLRCNECDLNFMQIRRFSEMGNIIKDDMNKMVKTKEDS